MNKITNEIAILLFLLNNPSTKIQIQQHLSSKYNKTAKNLELYAYLSKNNLISKSNNLYSITTKGLFYLKNKYPPAAIPCLKSILSNLKEDLY